MSGATNPERLKNLRDSLLKDLVERDLPIRLALIATLAGEHLLMVGPPGTAKSLIARRLHLAFSESNYFERLLTRFTVPEELFGPLSIKGLEEDRYERLTSSYLPKASIAFLDEIFKANSAILNSLLTLLNEREFDNGAQREKSPLIAVIGASNELPESEELDALFDRFLLRLHVGSVSKDAFPQLIGLRGHAAPDVPDSLKLTAQDAQEIQALAELVEVPEDVVALLCALREWCMAESIQISDRRWRKIVKLLQVSAWTNGREMVSIWDCWLLQHCLWNKPEDREKIYEWYAVRVGASSAMDPSQLTRIVVAWEGQLKRDQESRSQMRDEQGRLLFKSHAGNIVTGVKGPAQAKRGEELLYLSPAESWNKNNIKIVDRLNSNHGFTLDELSNLNISNPNHWDRNNTKFEHWGNKDSYLSDKNNWLMTEQPFSPSVEPTRHKKLYISDKVSQIDVLTSKVANYKDELGRHIQSMEAEIKNHIWVTSDFLATAAKNLKQTQHEVETLIIRVNKIHDGFKSLPIESDVSGLACDESL